MNGESFVGDMNRAEADGMGIGTALGIKSLSGLGPDHKTTPSPFIVTTPIYSHHSGAA